MTHRRRSDEDPRAPVYERRARCIHFPLALSDNARSQDAKQPPRASLLRAQNRAYDDVTRCGARQLCRSADSSFIGTYLDTAARRWRVSRSYRMRDERRFRIRRENFCIERFGIQLYINFEGEEECDP